MTSDRFDVDVMGRDGVRRAAAIMGPDSAAAQALREVDARYGGQAEVCRPVSRADTLIVVPWTDLRESGWEGP